MPTCRLHLSHFLYLNFKNRDEKACFFTKVWKFFYCYFFIMIVEVTEVRILVKFHNTLTWWEGNWEGNFLRSARYIKRGSNIQFFFMYLLIELVVRKEETRNIFLLRNSTNYDGEDGLKKWKNGSRLFCYILHRTLYAAPKVELLHCISVIGSPYQVLIQGSDLCEIFKCPRLAPERWQN